MNLNFIKLPINKSISLLKNKTEQKVLVFFTFPIVLLLIIELLHRQNILNSLLWPILHPVEFIINYVLILLVFSFFLALLGRMFFASTISLIIFSFLTLTSYCKKDFLGEPLFPTDFFLYKQVLNLLPNIYKEINLTSLLFVVCLFFIIFVFYIVFKKYSLRLKYRLILGTFSLLIICIISFNLNLAVTILPKLGIKNIDWIQIENYDRNGFSLGFLLNMKNVLISKPDQYNEQYLLSKIDAIECSTINTQNKAFKSPNVIIIMSEAFWDPTIIKDISFSSDPAPTLRALKENNSNGYLLSPAYGGGTSNVEFEVLTGNSTSFLPDGANAYQQYIKRPIPSLASLFAENGYKSIAIHSYHKWFFNRDRVYDLMGFEKFISLEDFKNSKYKGCYISDQEVSKRIIQEHKNSDKPVFMYIVTMQNHGPYNNNRYKGNHDISIDDKNLSEETHNILETFTQGVYDADASLKTVVDYFEKIDEPTVVVFFGDHLPMLGNDFSVYKETKYVKSQKSSWTKEEYKAMHSTPLLIWTNYEQKKTDLGTISACYLGGHLLDFINMKKPAYYKFLNNEFNKMPGNIKYLKIDNKDLLYNQTPSNLTELEATHWLFQYDIMFGKEYSKNLLFN